MKKRRLKKYKNHKISLCIYTYARLYTNARLTAFAIANSAAEIPQEIKEKMLDLCIYCEKLALTGYKEWRSENEQSGRIV